MHFRDLLVHPLMRGLDLDVAQTTVLRREVLSQKGFLRRIYEEWYRSIVDSLPEGEGTVAEIGTGPGFLRDFISGLVTSDILMLPGLSLVLDAHAMPFADGSLKAVVLIDVLHHLTDTEVFLREAARCVRPGGAAIMIEPWVTPWSRVVLGRLHYEPFDPEADNWKLPSSGPLSGANQALSWIIFHRDRRLFELRFPTWRVRSISLDMPLSFIVSGGLTMRSLAPAGAYGIVRAIERLASPWIDKVALFARIALERTAHRSLCTRGEG
jgi:SAM-dependent methyltransferase